VFGNKNVGTAKAVTLSGNTITGTDAGNYNLIQQTGLSADITKADLVVCGLTVSNKVYDTTVMATLGGTAAIAALGSDIVTLAGTAGDVFANKNVGTAKAITVTGKGQPQPGHHPHRQLAHPERDPEPRGRAAARANPRRRPRTSRRYRA